MQMPIVTPRAVLPWIGLLVVVAVTFSLGMWQLGRAQQKEAMQAELERQRALPALALDANSAPTDADRQRLATARGDWLPQANVFLENRQHQGQPGFWLVTPLRLRTEPVVDLLVVRGWAPRDIRERTLTPKVPSPAGPVSVTGRLGAAPAALSALGSGVVETGFVRLNLDLAAYAAQHQLNPWSLVLWQTESPAAPDGLVREWYQPGLNTAKHYGYAAQWFGIGLAAIGLMAWHRRKRARTAQLARHHA